MVSFGASVKIEELEIAFNARLDYEVEVNNYQRPMNAFYRSFRRLEAGFLVEHADQRGWYTFINPSLVDFLVNYLRSNLDEVRRISDSASYLTQLTTRLFPVTTNSSRHHITPRLRNKLLNNSESFIKQGSEDIDRMVLAMLLYRNFEYELVEAIITKLIANITQWGFLYEDYQIRDDLVIFISDIKNASLVNIIQDVGSPMIASLILSEWDISELFKLLDLIKIKTLFDLSRLFEKDDEYRFSEHLNDVLSEKIEEDIDELLNYSHPENFVHEMEASLEAKIQILRELGLNIKVNLSEYGRHDWWRIGMDNRLGSV
jgi:hypothetical protein